MSDEIKVGDLFYAVNRGGHMHFARVYKVTPKLAYICDGRDPDNIYGTPGAFRGKSQMPFAELNTYARSAKQAWLEFIPKCEREISNLQHQVKEQENYITKAKENAAKEK